mgnify:CR=1 FL=1
MVLDSMTASIAYITTGRSKLATVSTITFPVVFITMVPFSLGTAVRNIS